MSDLMFYGVLRMPYAMAMEGEISRIQFYHRAQEAADRVERAEKEIADLRAALAEASRKNLELSRVNAEQRLQEQRLDVALARARSALRDITINGPAGAVTEATNGPAADSQPL